jgi:capsular exopolysaccharide synthesis family protein
MQRQLPAPDDSPFIEVSVSRYGERSEELPFTYPALRAFPATPHEGVFRYLFRRYKRIFAVAAGLGTMLGVGTGLLQSPQYSARNSLEIQTVNRDFMNMREVQPTSESYSAESHMQTQVALLQSKSLIKRVTEKLEHGGAPREHQIPTTYSWLLSVVGINVPGREPPPLKIALKEAADSLRVRASGLTDVVEITCESTRPQLAAAFVNALADEYIQQNIQVRWNLSQETSEWLLRQMEEMRIKVQQSEAKLFERAKESGNLFSTDRENLLENREKSVQDELFRAQADRMLKQSKYELAKSGPLDALPEVLDDQVLMDLKNNLAERRRELANVLPSLTPSHPRVVRLQSQIKETEEEMDREMNRIFRRLENEYASAVRREKFLEAAELNEARAVSAQAVKAVEYNLAKHEAETNRRIYDGILQRVRENAIASAVPNVTVRVIDAAKEPEHPSSPRVALRAAAGTLAGIFCCFIFAANRERSDRSIRGPEELAALKVRELGIIPVHRLLSAPASEVRKSKADAASATAWASELAAWRYGPSLISDSFNATLTSLMFANRAAKGQVVVVTSPGPQEGKTTVCANLAVACAKFGHRVLLVDGDLRRPRLHAIFGVPKGGGFTKLLQDDEPVAQLVLNGAVSSTGVKNLFLLPSGAATGHVVQLLYSQRSQRVFAWFRKHFDMVFIDSPPMLQLPDARLLGQQSNAVILTVCAGKTTKTAVSAALAILGGDDITVIGTVLNKWDPSRSRDHENISLNESYYHT